MTTITNIPADITNLKLEVGSIKGNLGTIPSDVSTLKSNVSTIQSDLTTAKSNITTLQSDVKTAKSDITNRYTKTEVDTKLKSYLTTSGLSSALESGNHAGDFYPLTGREAFYLWDLRTTTAAANLYLDPNAAVSQVLRSTSSIRYKNSVETLNDGHADVIFNMRPVWYRSSCKNDRHDWGWYGLIAEEVGEIAPQYVHWRLPNEDDELSAISSNGLVAEGVMYERLVVPLIHHVKKLNETVTQLTSTVESLLKRVESLENNQNNTSELP